VFLLQPATAPRVVVFAGVDPGNGCSRICAETAEALAANGAKSVCVVEADLRQPSLPEFFGVTNHRGLTEALLQDGPVKSFVKQLHKENLWFLSSGSLSSDSPSLLSSDKLRQRVEELRQQFEYVLVDVPAMNLYADAGPLAKVADGVIVVLEANATRREAARKMMDSLESMGAKVLGAVLNKRTFPVPESLYRKL
jgi:capsular exopolysaccharide synthesis family protein